MSGIFVQPPAPGFSDLKPGEGAAYLSSGTVPPGAAAPQEGLPVGGGALGGVASSVAPEGPSMAPPSQGLAQPAPQQPQQSQQSFAASPGRSPISQQILAPSQRGLDQARSQLGQAQGAFYNQAGVNRDPEEAWDQTMGLLRQGAGHHDEGRNIFQTPGYSGPTGANEQRMRQVYDSAEAASPRAQSAQNIAQLPGLVRQASPGLTSGESRYEAAILRRDPEFYERARDLDQRIRGLQGRAQKFEQEAADYARDRANFAANTLPAHLRGKAKAEGQNVLDSLGQLAQAAKEREDLQKGLWDQRPETGDGDLASYIASNEELGNLAFQRTEGDKNERLSWDYLQDTPLARRESKAQEALEALLRANPQYQGKTVLTHTQSPTSRTKTQGSGRPSSVRRFDADQGVYPILGDMREGEGFDQARLPEIEGLPGFERLGNLGSYNAPIPSNVHATGGDWPDLRASQEDVERNKEGAAWPWVTSTQLVDIDPTVSPWDLGFRTPGEGGVTLAERGQESLGIPNAPGGAWPSAYAGSGEPEAQAFLEDLLELSAPAMLPSGPVGDWKPGQGPAVWNVRPDALGHQEFGRAKKALGGGPQFQGATDEDLEYFYGSQLPANVQRDLLSVGPEGEWTDHTAPGVNYDPRGQYTDQLSLYGRSDIDRSRALRDSEPVGEYWSSRQSLPPTDAPDFESFQAHGYTPDLSGYLDNFTPADPSQFENERLFWEAPADGGGYDETTGGGARDYYNILQELAGSDDRISEDRQYRPGFVPFDAAAFGQHEQGVQQEQLDQLGNFERHLSTFFGGDSPRSDLFQATVPWVMES